MKQNYQELLQHNVPPDWWDENGCPRYVLFNPKYCNPYANEAALLDVECQSCRALFVVGVSSDSQTHSQRSTLSQMIFAKYPFIYGDPPYVTYCCDVGQNQCTRTIRVVQFWQKYEYEWKRVHEYEGNFKDLPIT